MIRAIRRFIFLIVGALLALLVAGAGSDMLARQALQRAAERATGLTTHVEEARLGLLAGELSIERLRLDSGEGFESPHVLALERGRMTMPLRSLLSRRVAVEALHLHGIDVRIEHQRGRLNIQPILDRVAELRRVDPEAPGRRYVVRELVIADVTVHLNLGSLLGRPYALRLPLEEIRLTDVGAETETGLLLSQVAGRVLEAILEEVTDRAGSRLPPLAEPSGS